MKTIVIMLLVITKVILFFAGVVGILAVLVVLGGGIRDAFEYDFRRLGCLTIFIVWFLYCMVSVGVMRWPRLLVSGIVMQIIVLLNVYYFIYSESPVAGISYFQFVGIFVALWWLHFGVQFFYEAKIKPESEKLTEFP